MLNILMILSLVAVLGSLVFGLVSMFRGGQLDRTQSNKAMQWRILLQGFALLLFFITLWLRKH